MTHNPVLRRLRRKLEILREDFRSSEIPTQHRHDISECLALVELLEETDMRISGGKTT